ncbi:hypothetical protein DNTS_016144 [Danionella cerebrum]|uniref:Uncharacterized protein n=1 Tax=Danionella cerebrum TaxID=2873325 RepID=A0A553Q8U2_9TELE|nr:hypothetical protein DNTS_016144 [Danionella translucida]
MAHQDLVYFSDAPQRPLMWTNSSFLSIPTPPAPPSRNGRLWETVQELQQQVSLGAVMEAAEAEHRPSVASRLRQRRNVSDPVSAALRNRTLVLSNQRLTPNPFSALEEAPSPRERKRSLSPVKPVTSMLDRKPNPSHPAEDENMKHLWVFLTWICIYLLCRALLKLMLQHAADAYILCGFTRVMFSAVELLLFYCIYSDSGSLFIMSLLIVVPWCYITDMIIV